MAPAWKGDRPVAGNDDLVRSMHEMLEMLAPIREAMIGFRHQLEADGWSAESAEMIAANMFVGLQNKMFAA